MKRLGFLFVLAAAVCLAGPAGAQQKVGMGTMAPGTLANAMISAIAKVSQEKSGVSAVVQTYGGVSQYLPLLNSGEIQFANANAYETYLAHAGKVSYAGRANPNIRVVSVVIPLYQSIAVPMNSPIKSIADLKGKRLAGDFRAMKVLDVMLQAILATANLTPKDVTIVPAPNVLRGLDDLAKGSVDAAIGALTMPKAREVNAAISGGIRWLPLPDAPGGEAAMQKIAPPTYYEQVKPSRALVGIAAPTVVQAYDYLLLANVKTADDVVYRVAKAMHESKAGMAEVAAPLRAFAPEKMAKKHPVPYHPGAIRFYQEKGLWPPKM